MASERLQVILQLVAGQYKAEARAAASATGKISEEAKRTGSALSNLDRSMTTVGRGMAGFGVAVAGAFAVAAKAAIDWQTAFAGVRKTVDASEEEFAALEQGLLDISLRAPITAEELAKIAESAGQLGIANEAILEFTETMAALGVTTNLTSDEAATAFARVANIMQTPQDKFDEMGSTVVELGNNLATTEREIVDFALRIAGAGKQAGVSEAAVFSIAAAFSSVGIEAEAGGTAVQKVLLGITQAVATGSKDLDVFAQTAGMTARDFAKLWKEDAAEGFTRFVEGLSRAGDDAFVILEKLGLSDQRLIRSFLSLAGAGDLLRTSIELGNEAWEENTALTDEAAQRYATVASELQIAFNAAKVLAIEIGNLLLPAIRFAASAAKSFAEFLSNLPDPLKGVAAVLAGITGGLALFGGAALILIPRIAATVKAIRDLRLAIIALRTANVGGTIASVGASATVAGTFSGGTAAALAAPLAGALAAGLALEAHAEKMGAQSNGYTRFLYEVAKAAEWLGLRVKGNAVDAMDDLAVAAEGSDRHFRMLDPALRATGEAADEVAVAALAAGLGIDEASAAALLGIDPLEELGEAAEDPRDRLNELAAASRNQRAAFLESANPTFAAISAIQRWHEAVDRLKELRKDPKTAIEEISGALIDVARTKLEAQAALDAFSAGGIEAQVAIIADILGVADDEVIQLLNDLGLLDGTAVDVFFNYHHKTTFTTADAADAKAGTYTPGYIPNISTTTKVPAGAYASGGWAEAGEMYRVGERNLPELMMIPGDSGRVFSYAESRALMRATSGSGDTSFHFHGVETVDRSAIEEANVLAGIQRRVESRR